MWEFVKINQGESDDSLFIKNMISDVRAVVTFLFHAHFSRIRSVDTDLEAEPHPATSRVAIDFIGQFRLVLNFVVVVACALLVGLQPPSSALQQSTYGQSLLQQYLRYLDESKVQQT